MRQFGAQTEIMAFAGTVDQAFLQDFQCVSRSAMSAARF
jgi:hypothetical protein